MIIALQPDMLRVIVLMDDDAVGGASISAAGVRLMPHLVLVRWSRLMFRTEPATASDRWCVKIRIVADAVTSARARTDNDCQRREITGDGVT